MRTKISKFAYALRQVKKNTNVQSALTTYYAYAHAWLSYGVILWGNSTDAPTLFTLLKKLIRIIANIKQTESCKPHFQQLNILTLPCLYILELCKFVRYHPDFYQKREDIPTKYSLRHKNRLVIPPSKLQIHSSGTFVIRP